MIYMIVDSNLNPIRNDKGKLSVFTDISKLKKHSWRYVGVDNDDSYMIAKMRIVDLINFNDKNEID